MILLTDSGYPPKDSLPFVNGRTEERANPCDSGGRLRNPDYLHWREDIHLAVNSRCGGVELYAMRVLPRMIDLVTVMGMVHVRTGDEFPWDLPLADRFGPRHVMMHVNFGFESKLLRVCHWRHGFECSRSYD